MDQTPNRSCGLRNFGVLVGGPLLTGFVKFILTSARESGVKKLVMLARDGHVVKEALDILRVKDIEYCVMPSSRRMCVFPLAAEGDFQLIRALFSERDTWSARAVLEKLDLRESIDLVEGMADINDEKGIDEILFDLRDVLIPQAKREKMGLSRMLHEKIGTGSSAKEIAWVDVGWGLISLMALNRFLGAEVPAFFIGSHDLSCHHSNMNGYLFEKGMPLEVASAVMNAVEPIELLFSSSEEACSYACIADDGSLRLHYRSRDVMEKAKSNAVEKVHQGVFDFLVPPQNLCGNSSITGFSRWHCPRSGQAGRRHKT